MTQTTPDPRSGGRPSAPPGGRGWSVAAGVVCVLHVLVLLGLATFYGLELARGEGSSRTTVVMSGLLILVFAVLLAVLARLWFVGSGRATVPTLLWNGLLIPVVVALYGAEEPRIATGLLAVVVLGIITAVGAVMTRRPTE
ncbi:MAG TPA: hypothetical protein VFT68_06330 [Lapillicoccus sp.]|nr:hypothetical protein [Lapillicoccus sp.]